MLYHLGQNHLETNFAETNFPNAKTLIWAFWLAQTSVFVFGKLVSAKTLIWAVWLAQIRVFAFGKLISAKLVFRWFCSKPVGIPSKLVLYFYLVKNHIDYYYSTLLESFNPNLTLER